MVIHQCCRFALASAFALVAPGLVAGEIVLFDGPNFQGASIAFRGTMQNLDATGFNDRTASISVRDGTWEVCFHADFQGGCMQLQPGDYPRLDPPFDRSISSLREVSGAASYPAPAPQQAMAANEITLFDGDNFQGDRMAFGESVPNLDGTGFNDRAASISVRGGSWEVCFDADFQGGCMQLQPGDYPRLDPPFDRNISSVRPLDGAGYGGTYAGADAASQASFGADVPGTSIGVDLPSYPELVPVPGYPVYYAPQLNSNYFFYDGMYWVYQRDNWYASSWYNGPWGLVAPAVVPLFVLRVPVGYYRRPPVYFRGWSANAPPRWGDRWGNTWVQSHRGWDNWNRNAVPRPAPLPLYQRQYSGYHYPPAAQQRTLQSQNYRYQPQDAVVRQHYQAQQQGQTMLRGQPPQRGGGAVQQSAAPAPTPQQGTAPYSRGQSPQTGGQQGKRPPSPTPYQQGAAPPSRGQPPHSGGSQGQRPAEPTPYQPGAAPPPRVQSPQTGGRDNQKPGTIPDPSQPGGPTAGKPRQQPGSPPPQSGQQPPRPQGGDKGPQGKPPSQEPKQGPPKEKGDPRGGEPGK